MPECTALTTQQEHKPVQLHDTDPQKAAIPSHIPTLTDRCVKPTALQHAAVSVQLDMQCGAAQLAKQTASQLLEQLSGAGIAGLHDSAVLKSPLELLPGLTAKLTRLILSSCHNSPTNIADWHILT